MNPFNKVDELRELLQKQHPSLSWIPDPPPKRRLQALSVTPSLVRPTISPTEIAGMLQYSSKHKKIKEIDFGPTPKNFSPLKVKAQHYEAETSLDCFMKHIATKSFERYKLGRVPAFRKSDLTEISIFDDKKRKKRKRIIRKMNVSNLEIFGQIEVRSVSPKFEEKNLRVVEKGIRRNVKGWYLQEKKKIDLKGQMVDHFTFRFKNKLGGL